MLILLLGPDDFSKREFLKDLAQKSQAELELCLPDEPPPSVLHLTERNLFSQPKIFVLEGCLSQLSWNKQEFENLILSSNHIILVEEKIDRRIAKNKDLLANKKIQVKDFILPHGGELNAWIAKRVKDLGGKFSKEAIEALAVRLGRDESVETKAGGKVVQVTEVYSLWQADSEIKKLLAYTKGEEVEKDDVALLVSENEAVDVLEIANAIGEGNKQLALSLVGKFLGEQSAADEKAGVIQLNALLAEQFRNVGIVQDFLLRRVPEKTILEKTFWKTGRLFVLKKISQKFQHSKILELLEKLEALDEELKTSSTPPKVLVDLILAQLF